MANVVVELPEGTGSVICPDFLCPGADRPVDDRPRAAYVRATSAIGPYSIVRRARQLPHAPGFPDVAIVVAAGPRHSPFKSRWTPIIGTGVALRSDDARVHAVAEVLERYCLLAPRHREGARDSTLVCAHVLRTGAARALPAALVHPSAGGDLNGFPVALTSTGMACHVRLDAAALSALLEVVERDALMAHWLCRRIPRRIRIDPSTPVGQLIQERFSQVAFDYVFVDLSIDTAIPTVACIAFGRDAALPSAVMGCAARSTPEDAAIKALFEVTQVARAVYERGCSSETTIEPGAALTIEGRAFLYGSAGGADLLSWFSGYPGPAAEPETSLAELPRLCAEGLTATLRAAVGRVEAAGMEPVIVDLTTADVGDLGYRAVRVLVPEAIDIAGDPRSAPHTRDRLTAVAARMGWPEPDPQLNPLPCPLA